MKAILLPCCLLWADSLVVIPGVEVFRADIRKVRIDVQQQTGATQPTPEWGAGMRMEPNPSAGPAVLRIQATQPALANWRILGHQGCILQGQVQVLEGENRLALPGLDRVPAGFMWWKFKCWSNGRR
ncbi:MAG: hypothetical protein IT260_11535 [Saprospiraceae bacterium]|nr:hypothetical protein [Saprospiraceae bacterium]